MVFLAALGLSSRSKGASPEQAFWTWFEAHQTELLAVKSGQEKIVSELAKQLRKINPSLVFEFGPEKNGRRQFTVSADGIKDAFPAVEALCSAAPTLPTWKILKFRQRREPSDISYQGVTVKADSVRAELTRNGEKVDIVLSIPGYTQSARNTYLGIAFLMLDETLGEYDVEMFVGQVRVEALRENPASTVRLKELPKLIDAMFVH